MAPGTTVVVGAAHGIGAAIARRVAGEAWTDRRVIAGISDEPMDALANELRRDDLQVDVVQVGLADQTSIAALVAATSLLSPDSAQIAFHDLYIDGGETLGI
jgi:NAD(P)-dependent dehydrogenase (short-subunit alcohol dehydrogenase family)